MSGGPKREGGASEDESLVSRVVNTEGDRPKLKAGALASMLVSILYYGFTLGVVGLVNTVRRGIRGAFNDLEAWVAGEGGLISTLFAIPEDAFDIAFAETAALLGRAGLVAQGLALLEVLLGFLLVGWLATDLLGRLVRGVAG